MRRHLPQLLAMVLLQILASVGGASSILRLPLQDLVERSELVVLADVVAVAPVAPGDNRDEVTIRIIHAFQGKMTSEHLTFVVTCRGGLKDFDPQMKVGDTGVFFLRNVKENRAEKAYWGSMALFPKPNFDARRPPLPD